MYPLLMGVDLSLRFPSREIAGQHADSQNLSFSLGNPYIYRLLMGVDLSLRSPSREIAGQHADSQNLSFS